MREILALRNALHHTLDYLRTVDESPIGLMSRLSHAYILWSAETEDDSYEAATDTFVVRKGKIVAQSFAAKITPKC
jgi:hypothetical protein